MHLLLQKFAFATCSTGTVFFATKGDILIVLNPTGTRSCSHFVAHNVPASWIPSFSNSQGHDDPQRSL